jgi:hypothetical protein
MAYGRTAGQQGVTGGAHTTGVQRRGYVPRSASTFLNPDQRAVYDKALGVMESGGLNEGQQSRFDKLTSKGKTKKAGKIARTGFEALEQAQKDLTSLGDVAANKALGDYQAFARTTSKPWEVRADQGLLSPESISGNENLSTSLRSFYGSNPEAFKGIKDYYVPGEGINVKNNIADVVRGQGSGAISATSLNKYSGSNAVELARSQTALLSGESPYTLTELAQDSAGLGVDEKEKAKKKDPLWWMGRGGSRF